jgi:AcrR family transcriptional regulator
MIVVIFKEKRTMTDEKKPISQEKLGLRERNKQDKRKRIQDAAWQLFTQKGFAATTTREVAELAQVASGTLFLYAKDKQDLLQLVYYEVLAETIERAFRTLPDGENLLDTLVYLFQQFFQLYQQHPDNTRAYIKATIFLEPTQMYGPQTFQQVADFVQRLAALLAQFQQKGEIAQDISLEQASANLFALYFTTLGRWLNGQLTFEEAQGQALRQTLALQIQGLRPVSQENSNDNEK